MTTEAIGNRSLTSLEELVGRLMDALRWKKVPAQVSSLVRTVHEARRLLKAGDLDGALAALANADMTNGVETESHWLHSEWLGLMRRRFGDRELMVYRPSAGRAAALIPMDDDGTLEVVAVLGMEWQPGELVSCRSLRGLRPLDGGGSWS